MGAIKYLSKAGTNNYFFFQSRTCLLLTQHNPFCWKAIVFFILHWNKAHQNCRNFFHNCFSNLGRVGMAKLLWLQVQHHQQIIIRLGENNFLKPPHEDNWEKWLNFWQNCLCLVVVLLCRDGGRIMMVYLGIWKQHPGWELAVQCSTTLTSTYFLSSDHQ